MLPARICCVLVGDQFQLINQLLVVLTKLSAAAAAAAAAAVI